MWRPSGRSPRALAAPSDRSTHDGRGEGALLDSFGELFREQHRGGELAEAFGKQGAPDVFLVRPDGRGHGLPCGKRARGGSEELARKIHVAVRGADLADVRVAFQAAERKSEGTRPRFFTVDERGVSAHGERIAADEVRRVVGAAPATHVEIGE